MLPSVIGTPARPLAIRGFGAWDMIVIRGITFVLADQPKYERKTRLDKKGGPGHDNTNNTGKGQISSDIHIDLLLWLDTSGYNWLQVYADLVPLIQSKDPNKRFAVPVYAVGLTNLFGINSIVVTSCSTPQYKGKQMFTASIKAADSRHIGKGNATKKMVRADQLGGKTVVNRDVVNPPQSPNQSIQEYQSTIGPASAEQLQSRVNTPATRSTRP